MAARRQSCSRQCQARWVAWHVAPGRRANAAVRAGRATIAALAIIADRHHCALAITLLRRANNNGRTKLKAGWKLPAAHAFTGEGRATNCQAMHEWTE